MIARQRILKNLVDLVTGTFISRIVGFLRELVTAAFYGTNKSMDLFVIAFTIPTFFRQFLGEDVVERAFMPPFKKLISQQKLNQAWRLLSSCLNIMTVSLLVFMGFCYLIAPFLVRVIAPGLETQFMHQAVIMTYWLLPFMVLIGLAAFVGGVLNFFEMNRIYSFAPVMLSIGVIIGIYGFQNLLGIYALAAGFLIGGLLTFLVQIPFLWAREIRQTQARYYGTIDFHNREFRTVGRESGFIVLKALLDKSVEIVGRMLASFLVSGSIASLWFAQRLFQMPVAILGLAISRSLIPFLTEKKALTHDNAFLYGIKSGIRLNYLLMIPTTTIMIVTSSSIISIVYQRGSFDETSTSLTSLAFLCYVLGLLGLSLNSFFARIFSIFQKNKVPLYISVFSAIMTIILNFVLVKTPLKHGGIALSSSIAFSVNSIVLYYFLHKELKGQLSAKTVITEFLITLVYGIIAGGLTWFIFHTPLVISVSQSIKPVFLMHCIHFLIATILVITIFGLLIVILGPVELKEQVQRVYKRTP
ncbi:murein biosynthesis integral membrane protein MurJ [candidate division KSB1 bacterium]|nr:murein biosynthesis integral membrane protein MurJ [candidate division KSB1 bacterium]